MSVVHAIARPTLVRYVVRAFAIACAVLAEAGLVYSAVYAGHYLTDVDPLDGTPMTSSLTMRILNSPYWVWGMPLIGAAGILWLALRARGIATCLAAAVALLVLSFVTMRFS